MKKQTEGRAAKGGMALRRALAGALAVLMLCTAAPVYAQAPADAAQPAASQGAQAAGSAPVQEGTAGGDASSVPGQGAASEAPEAPSEGDASGPTLPAEEEPSEGASAPAQEAGAASPEQAEEADAASSEQEADAPVEQAAEPAPQAASDAEAGGEATAAQTSTNLPVAGQTYWFSLEGATTDMTGINNAKNKLPAGLKWVPMIFSGTIDAYVMQQNAPQNQQAAIKANGAFSKDDYQYGWRYDHQVFIATDLVTKASYNWNWIGNKGDKVIFGKDHEANGVTYTLRSPSGGLDGAFNQTTAISNAEWTVLWNKGYIKNSDTNNTSATQNFAPGKNTTEQQVIFMMTDVDAQYRRMTTSNAYNCGWRPLLEVPQEAENTLHAVALDFGGFKLKAHEGYTGGDVKTMNVVMVEGSADITRPAYSELAWAGAEGATPKEESLIWIADNGRTYAFNAKIPVTGITKLTLGVKDKDESGAATPGITITQHPADVTAAVGDSAVFTVEAVSDYGVGTLSYTWEVKQPQAARTLAEDGGWQTVSGRSSYAEANVQLAQTGTQYRCKVTLTYTEVGADGTETQKTIEAYSNAATLTVTKADTPAGSGSTGSAGGGAGAQAGQKPNPKTGVDGWQGFWEDARRLLGL